MGKEFGRKDRNGVCLRRALQTACSGGLSFLPQRCRVPGLMVASVTLRFKMPYSFRNGEIFDRKQNLRS